MKRIAWFYIIVIALVAGCTAAQIERLQTDEQLAETTFTAATQATAAVKESVASLPVDVPGRAQATRTIASAEKSEVTARLALDIARAALDAARRNDAADPALKQSLSAAINAIPSPWTPVLASLVPAALPLVVSVMQSVRLGRAHQTVARVTEQLEAHKAALEALAPRPAASDGIHADSVAGLPL